MGIHGIYKEIGSGKRIALSKLAVDKYEETGRPLRIAIDTSIWLFQIQASKGGSNPALRTFYYRLLRLISLAIHPIFVFDGPNKPPFKRNKRTGPNVASVPEFLAKQLLKQFGYPIHLAPGEAEAECALLQRQGIVDAVLSEDVDTLMFGSSITIRNWSPEKTGKTPTHVNVYDAAETKAGSDLDREGMILIALMSGGDYVPEGIPGCGPKTACEAARAGFGHKLCKIVGGEGRDKNKNKVQALRDWRIELQHELKTNENKHFKRKHGALKIPDDFPRLDILGYYTHPVVSPQATLDKLRRSIRWDQDLDFPGLRAFTHDAFDWAKLEGAKHFIRSLAPCLLVRQLWLRAERLDQFPFTNIQAIQEDESLLIKGIHGKRQHPITDNSTELRVSFVPIDLVKIDLNEEEPDNELDAQPPSSQIGEVDENDMLGLNIEDDDGPKKSGPTKFEPEKPARLWVMKTFIKVGVPLKIQDWEAERQIKLKPRQPGRAATTAQQGSSNPGSKAKNGTQRTKRTANTSQTPIERFAKVTKPGSKLSQALKTQEEAAKLDPPVSNAPTNVIELFSSPSAQHYGTELPLDREKSLSPLLEELPPSVTKRRRRGPMQRSHTLPIDVGTRETQSSIPPVLDTIEILDLVEPLELAAPLQTFATDSFMPAPKVGSPVRCRGTLAESTLDKSKQTTLDTWKASLTPKKSNLRTPGIEGTSLPGSLQPEAYRDDVDALDLTVSSLSRPLLSQTQDTNLTSCQQNASGRKHRAPLTAVSSSALNTSTGSKCSRSSSSSPSADQDILRKSTRSQRTSSDSRPTSSVVETIALNSSPLRPRPKKRASSELETLDLGGFSSSPSQSTRTPTRSALDSLPLAGNFPSDSLRSPKIHKSNSSDSSLRRKSPRAARKAQETKKRHIILRKSLAGAWTFEDIDNSPAKSRGCEDDVPKAKQRRKWRESEVEILDLT